MLIKNNTRVLTENGLQTYKSIGATFHMHNRFFSGTFIILLKYSYRDLNHSIDTKLKQGVHYIRIQGFNSKFLELRMFSIPKGK